MIIHGLQKLTLLDYPGKVAATLFLGGCNFRCPFCQNSGLVLSPNEEAVIPTEEVLKFLKKRQGILDGICITGGEPTLSPDLKPFIQEIHSMGYLVKLDTNGTNPQLLKELMEEELLDYIAMDIKSSRKGYARCAGLDDFPEAAQQQLLAKTFQSAELLMEGRIPFEFRTTVVKELHDASDFEDISLWLAGCPAYYLQAYRDSDQVLCPETFHSYTRPELEVFRQILKKTISVVEIRGLDT